MLLSESAEPSPLLLLDPSSWSLSNFQKNDTAGAYVWPSRDATQNVLRFYTPHNMQQGDAIFFKSGDVAHGSGKRLSGVGGAVLGKRISFDMRCRCAPFSSEPVQTARGELCAASWRPSLGSALVHGCLHTAETPWCIIRRGAPDAGAGCVLQDGSLCAYP